MADATIGAGGAWLLRRAARTPDRSALLVDGRRVDYGELAGRALALAAHLTRGGVAAGARVALWAPNGEAFVVALGATAILGAAVVPLNTRLRDDEVRHQLMDSAPAAILAAPPFDGRARDLGAAAAVPVVRLEEALWAGSARTAAVATPTLAPAADTAPFAVVYTSGTTGRPKGAIVSAANLWHSAVAQALTLGAGPDDRWLACLPLFHVSGLALLTRAWLYGQLVIVHERFEAGAVSAAIDQERVTAVSLVPTALADLLDARDGRPLPPSLRLVLLGGGPAPRPLLERSLALGVPVAVTYGLTETASQAATLPPAALAAHLGSVGTALLPNDIAIVRPDGSQAPEGEVGEILVRGPTVTPGYLGQPEATARALRDGWLRTGDLGQVDAEGYLFVADRREDLIVSGGENVYPAEVESVLVGHPDIADAAVVGVADARWGQAVAAAVVARGTAQPTLETVGEHVRRHLADYKVPKHLLIVASLPRTASGKLRRRAVRDLFPSGGAGAGEKA